MTTLYLIFDEYGKYMGYSDNKKKVQRLVNQRKKFQKLYVEKFNNKMLNQEVIHDLHMSEGDIFKYFGVYLFEHEEDSVYMDGFEKYRNMMDNIELYIQQVSKIKFEPEEEEIVMKYTAALHKTAELMMMDYFSTGEFNKSKHLNNEKFVLDIIKKIYKGGKKKK